jgi:hypothetical protein
MKTKRLAHRPNFCSLVVKLGAVTTESTNSKFARDLMVAESIRPRNSPECTCWKNSEKDTRHKSFKQKIRSSLGIRVVYLSTSQYIVAKYLKKE